MHLRAFVNKIHPYTEDKKLWMHFFQESLTGPQLEWYYQLDSANIRSWTDLAQAFYKQYQYNSDLAPTRMQLQGMTMGAKESFKEYAQKWRDLAGRVQPPLSDRELVEMFMNTLTGVYYDRLIGSTSVGFTEMVLAGERIEGGIRAGKIQVASSSSGSRKTFNGYEKKKEESNAVHHRKGRQGFVNAVTMPNNLPQAQQRPRQRPGNQQGNRQQKPKRNFDPLPMPRAQVLQWLMELKLADLRPPTGVPTPIPPNYNVNARCAFHSDSPGHDTEDCLALKHRIQDLIDAGEINFAPERPNVEKNPMPNHV